MAKIDLKFIDSRCGHDYIQTNIATDDILISGIEDGRHFEVYLDKSTAIKFAKTLRTEINKIT